MLKVLRAPTAVLGLFAALAVVMLAVSASPATAADAQKWILEVGPQFQAVDVQAAGGTLEWHWQEAGLAVAVSSDPQFGDKVLGQKVTLALADFPAHPRPLALASEPRPAASGPAFDAYASRWQWYWQAIGAVRYDASGAPQWQLGDYEGSGVKIGIIDTGAPAIWDPPDDTNFVGFGNPVAFHPEFHRYDPANPAEGGVVLLEDPASGAILNYDAYGHGTAVGSILGSRRQAEGAMKGLTPKATLYFHKIDFFNWVSSAIEGWYMAAEFGCRILNNSWSDVEIPVWRFDEVVLKLPRIARRALNELHRRGVLVVAAAGNDGIDLEKHADTFYPWAAWGVDSRGLSAAHYIPQGLPHTIVVGGTGPSDYDPSAPDIARYDPQPGAAKGSAFNLDRFVNVALGEGWAAGSSYGSLLTVTAPMGTNIKDWSSPIQTFQLIYVATAWTADQGYPYHDWLLGTSFSSPMTAGVAALAAEAYQRVHGEMPSPAKLASILKESADDQVGPATDDFWVWNEKTLQFELIVGAVSDRNGRDERYGYGRVNAKRAIELASR